MCVFMYSLIHEFSLFIHSLFIFIHKMESKSTLINDYPLNKELSLLMSLKNSQKVGFFI